MTNEPHVPALSRASWLRTAIHPHGALEPAFASTFAAASLTGAVVGLLAAAFRRSVEAVQGLVESGVARAPEGLGWLCSMLLSATLVALALWLVRRFAPEAGGSGVQEIEGALEGSRPVRWQRVIPVKFFGGVSSLASGLAVGREGPTVQMGANCGAMLHQALRLPRASAHALLAAGSAAGLAAAFNAPLAGVLFVLEEMRPKFRHGFLSVQAVLIASACADVTVRAVTNDGPVFEFDEFAAPGLSGLWLFPLFGALVGLLGVALNASLMGALGVVDRLSARKRWVTCVMIGAGVGLVAWVWRDASGGGYTSIVDSVGLNLALPSLIGLFCLRFVVTVASYATGVPGGIFTPMLALGALCGVSVGLILQAIAPSHTMDPTLFAVIGMGALFSSTVRAPLTGLAIAIELTGSFELILPILLACTMATLVAESMGGRPIYALLLERAIAKDAKASGALEQPDKPAATMEPAGSRRDDSLPPTS